MTDPGLGRTLGPVAVLAVLAWSAGVRAQNLAGRDFPKTLTFDEPGIDDEISLPTFIVAPRHSAPRRQTDLDFELDKRITARASVQINVGYTNLPQSDGTASGWQNVAATLKYVVLAEPDAERLASLSLTREFGHSGAARIAEPVGRTIFAINAGQGFAALSQAPFIQPLAITGSAGCALPDRRIGGVGPDIVLALSAQYSLDVFARATSGLHTAAFARPLIPIVEWVQTRRLDGRGGTEATLAPGLIYAGDGFQLAAEALVPLTSSAGRHVGAIVQLNVSLGVVGVARLARPLFSVEE